MAQKIRISPDGTFTALNTPVVAKISEKLGRPVLRRASHVEPVNRVLRTAFHWIRRIAGEKGAVASFTRVWPCMWRANLAPSNGPIFGPFKVRKEAIDAEIKWLQENDFGGVR
jgi:hypothetical protein